MDCISEITNRGRVGVGETWVGRLGNFKKKFLKYLGDRCLLPLLTIHSKDNTPKIVKFEITVNFSKKK